jgi:hypothetical protein
MVEAINLQLDRFDNYHLNRLYHMDSHHHTIHLPHHQLVT